MKVTVFLYDPSADAKPYQKTYDVPWKQYITVLEVLTYIHENYDPIAFDYSCRGRVCGRCTMMLNGEPIMACVTTVPEDQDITIKPLNGFPVIRDLIVDKSKLHDKLTVIYHRVRYKPLEHEDVFKKYDVSTIEKVKPLEWCCRCGNCIASCPVYNEEGGPGNFIGSAGLVASALRHYDPNDQGDRLIEAVRNGLFNCIQCGKCDEVCPAQEIKHVETFSNMMAEAEKKGLKP